jgi:hypothetical protein
MAESLGIPVIPGSGLIPDLGEAMATAEQLGYRSF